MQPVTLLTWILSQLGCVSGWERCICNALHKNTLSFWVRCRGEMTSRASWPGAGKQTLIAEWLLWWRIVCQPPQSGLWAESYVMETRQMIQTTENTVLGWSLMFLRDACLRVPREQDCLFSSFRGLHFCRLSNGRQQLCDGTTGFLLLCYVAH